MSETYVNLQFNDEKIRLTVLTNVCRMLIKRGYMNIDKYKKTNDGSGAKKQKPEQLGKQVVDPPSEHDPIDNELFLPFIGSRVDNNVYIIPLDTNYRDEREAKSEGHVDFDGSSVIVKIIPQVVKDVANSPILNDFFKTYSKHHKIVIFDGMSDKVYNTFRRKKNAEAFDRDALMIDLMSLDGAPISCEFVSLEDIAHITNPKLPKIHENDPVCRYYNGKKGQIMRVVRTSINNSQEIGYRRVDDPKPVFN
ncbi:DNA-directed RNA polymerase subunit 5 [Yasminevirus sp. GU-2018]|uniref:DNA-directed RNA polymerase subunit 5 n=1 Tax=Yasminevirus sp. GU-2018 TaxID=2420051 RepID=A0A5K0UBD9_9VIRU|nr:DNA-directed RNA polymerase subunit 5 [Yasminevirus sp. GU-2018]